MQATRTLLTIALLLGGMPGGSALAEYPFGSMYEPGDTQPPGPWSPSRTAGPMRRGSMSRGGLFGDSRGGGLLSRGLFRNVSQSRGASAMVDGPSIGAPPHEGPSSPIRQYDTVPYDNPSYGGDPYGADSYGDPFATGPHEAGPYEAAPYDDLLGEYGPAGGPGYDEPYQQGELFRFDAGIYPGFIAGNLTPGTDRFLFGGEWFQPLYQDGRTLWYFNFRGQGDDNSASEFNTGTGVRVLTDPGWIFGGYAYWDHLRSQNGNTFNQGMIGMEAMSVLWDARFNVYFPESGPQAAGPAIASVSGGNLVVSSGLERAYWGMDFELGSLLWAYGPNAQHELRGFAAIYHFDHSAAGADSITGPRLRGEYRWYDLPYFGPGSRFTCGLTVQVDDERDGQLFAFAKLRIPLDPWAHSRRPLSPLHRRMLDSVVRDVDVVTDVSRQIERAVNPVTGREVRGYARIDAGTAGVADLLAGLDTDSVIVLDGSAGVIHAPTGYQLKSGQTVIGADTPFEVTGAGSGRMATFNPGGERPTLDFGQNYHTQTQYPQNDGPQLFVLTDVAAPTYGLQMNDQTLLVGVDIQNVDIGIGVTDVEDVLIHDVEVSDYGTAGIEISGSKSVLLHDVGVKNAALGPWFDEHPDLYPYGRGIVVAGSSDVAIEDSEIEDAKMEGLLIAGSQNVTIRNTSIRDTALDGIRLVDTKNVLIEDVELKNTGEIDPNQVSDMPVGYQLSSITLSDTENTIISHSTIHGSDSNGIFGYNATATIMHDLDIADVENGIVFGDSSDISVTDSKFLFANDTRSAGPQLPSFRLVQHSGVVVWGATGTINVSDNTIEGGLDGRGIYVHGSDGTTDLRIENNAITKSGVSTGIEIRSGTGHTLTGDIVGNTVSVPGTAFALEAFSNGSHNDAKSLVIQDNEWNGEFRARIYERADVDLVISGNVIGGNPMGFIRAEDDATLKLEYTGNTSTPGAAAIRFINDGANVNATINGNDHTPLFQAP